MVLPSSTLWARVWGLVSSAEEGKGTRHQEMADSGMMLESHDMLN